MKSSLLDEKRFVKCKNADSGKIYQLKKNSDICPVCGCHVREENHEVISTEEDRA